MRVPRARHSSSFGGERFVEDTLAGAYEIVGATGAIGVRREWKRQARNLNPLRQGIWGRRSSGSPASGRAGGPPARPPPGAWDRPGQHPEYALYTIFGMARHVAVHDMLHGYRIEDFLRRSEAGGGGPGPLEPPALEPEEPAVEVAIPGSLARMRAGEVNLLGPFQVPGLRRADPGLPSPELQPRRAALRALHVRRPERLRRPASFSGGWYLHEAVEGLAKSRRQPVVIGIEHGGPGRNLELSPFPFDADPGQIAILLDWVTGHLMPALTTELNLVPGPLGAVIGGSSMGGLAAFWSHFHYPQAFGGALVMSPSFWVANQAIFVDIAAQPAPPVSRIYLDAGAREDKGGVVEAVKRMAELLIERDYDSDRLMWRADPKGTHSEAAWRRRLPRRCGSCISRRATPSKQR